MLNYQAESGYFVEADNGTLHQAYRVKDKNDEKSHVALTAHVLIGLEEALHNIQGVHKLYVASAKQRGLAFLERMLAQIDDAYQLCIVTYALALLKSPETDIAYGRLLAASLTDDGKVYWSPTPIKANR